jgi:hypothetical protein
MRKGDMLVGANDRPVSIVVGVEGETICLRHFVSDRLDPRPTWHDESELKGYRVTTWSEWVKRRR